MTARAAARAAIAVAASLLLASCQVLTALEDDLAADALSAQVDTQDATDPATDIDTSGAQVSVDTERSNDAQAALGAQRHPKVIAPYGGV